MFAWLTEARTSAPCSNGLGAVANARHAQEVEARLACNVLNRMTELGRPRSFAFED